MVRLLLLLIGFLLLIIQQYVQPVSVQMQFIVFITGIILLGVPHGAADLLVANQNAVDEKKTFSKLQFHCNYMGRLVMFAAIIWFFPIAGNLLFILFAAYHFGETDLHQFNTNTLAGKMLVVSYGLVILSAILISHFEELLPLSQSLPTGKNYQQLFTWINEHRLFIIAICGALFIVSSTFYVVVNTISQRIIISFLLQFAVILIILFKLPMVLGFTFYFIVWHSVLSLQNIITFLRADGFVTAIAIIKQIGFYSLLAMGGVVLFGLTGFMFSSSSSIMVYVFLGLAVLTAPHMQIMHEMYNSIRFHRTMTGNR